MTAATFLWAAIVWASLAWWTWRSFKRAHRADLLRRAGYARINGYLVRVERAP